MLSLHLERIRPFRDRPYLGNHKIPKAASVVAIVAEPVAYKAIALSATFSFAVGEIQPGLDLALGGTRPCLLYTSEAADATGM